jgi:RHS repeat-associated protein
VQVYHADGLGSVRALTDTTSPTPLVVQTYRTDEFGIADRLSSIGISTQPLQYTGEQRDAESSFMYLRARMYDPSIGRFVSRDTLLQGGPTSQGFNRYAYANNRPTVLVDPSGHRVCRLNATLGGLSASTAVQIPDSIACPEAPSLPNWGELEAEFLRKLTGCEWIRPDIQWGDIDDTRDPGWLTIVDHGVPDGGHVLKTDSDIAGVEPTIPIVDDARKIAQGHASEKLAEQFPELANTQQLAELVNDAMLFGDKRDLRDGRTGYMLLYDDTVVIHDPNHPDRGTVVRPPLFDKTDTWIYFTEKLA